MKFCMIHWDRLKTEIQNLGMEPLMAKTGEDVMAKMVQEVEVGQTTKTTFDPLMGAHNAILSRALDIAGLNLMMQNEDGTDRCPLCYLQQQHDLSCKEEGCTHSFEPWIGFAAKDMLAEAKSLGLMSEA